MIFLPISVLLLLFGVSIKEAYAGNTTYVVALLGQDIQNDTVNPDINYELVLSTNSTSSISVDVTGIDGLITTLTVDDTGKTVHTLDQTKGMNGSEYSNKSIIVHSADGFFTLQVFITRGDHNYIEGFLGIPIQSLAGPNQPVGQTVYSYVAATFCDVGGYCQLAVAALNDKTAVSIVLPSHVEEIVCCKGKGYHRSKRDTAFTLNKFDSIQFESTYDLTGTVIYSFEPIVVFAGSRNVSNGEVIAHTAEQLVPSSHWGTEYVVTNLGTNGYGDILKIVSHWSDTKITMKGFPSFILKNRYQTAVRRLDKGFSSHIQASHPIQVVQITGLTYATENETSTLSMTVVPSVQNAYTEPVTVACHGAAAQQAQFYIVTEKLSAPTTEVSGGRYDSEIEIKYSDYMTGGLETSATTYTINNTAAGKAISGVMKCDTATMPTSVIFNENVSGTSQLTATYNGGTCYEGGKASTLFDSSSDSVTPYALDLQAYPGHVLQLRVRACGEAVLQFFMNENDLTNSLFLTVTHKQMTVTKCFPDCGTGPTFVIDDTAGFNSAASADWDCEADMAFFWFHQKTDNSKHYICFGVGKYDEAVCTGAETTTYFEITSRFKNVKMMGMASDAAFNWDFVHTGGCDLYESDWRCMDRWTNCSIYGTSFCSDAQHNDFAVSYCAKYCGKCFADSYGRKFLAKTPYVNPSTDCLMIVSPLNKQTNVAVTLKDTNAGTEKVQHGARNHNGERYYDCSESLVILDAYTILSDDEVAVNILLTYSGEIKSYRIYPVDTFGTEVMVLEYSDEKKRCRFLSEHDSVNYVAYYSINKLGGTGDSEDSERVQLGALSHLATTNLNDMSGTVFKFDKPSTVFCGDLFSSSTVHNQYNQLLPTNTWSTEYVVPAFDVEAVNRPFDGKLFIVSNADNTIVNISGGFDAIHAIYNRGDKIEQEIDVGAAYKIKASENIGVGLYLYDPADPTKASFNMLVPAQSFHDTVLTSVPNNVLNDVGFDVTEIKTYFIDGNLNGTIVSKEADDTDPFYRHVSIGSSIYEMTVVQSGTEKWFVVPGNVKSAVIQNQGQVCEMSPQSDNDGIDNDCDGLIDEDTRYSTYGVYREDRDLDGGFGEDSSEVLNEPVVIKKPREPICLEIKKPPGQCWTICFCKCSWVKKYEEQKNLTHDELVEAQQDDIQQLQNELQVDEDSLQTATAEKESASDERQSAANIGYIGICMFGVVFGTIFIMDISSLVRDLRILLANLREGFERLSDCIKRKIC